MGQNNLIIDLDPQGNATTGLGKSNNDEDKNIYNLLIKKKNLSQVIQKTNIKNLDVIGSNVNLSGLEVETANDSGRAFVLKQILDTEKNLLSNYDNIFIDCPPSLSLLTIMALVASEELLVPLQTEFFALEGITQLVKTIDRIKINLNPELKVRGILLTMFDKRNKLSTHRWIKKREIFLRKKFIKPSYQGMLDYQKLHLMGYHVLFTIKIVLEVNHILTLAEEFKSKKNLKIETAA